MNNSMIDREREISLASEKLKLFDFLGGFERIVNDSVKIDFNSNTFCYEGKENIKLQASKNDFEVLKNIMNSTSFEYLMFAYNRKMLIEKEKNDEFELATGKVKKRGRSKL